MSTRSVAPKRAKQIKPLRHYAYCPSCQLWQKKDFVRVQLGMCCAYCGSFIEITFVPGAV